MSVTIEVVFSQSAYGSLKIAQQHSAGKYSDNATNIIDGVIESQKLSKKEIDVAKISSESGIYCDCKKWIPLDGNAADIFCIDVAWSMGDIVDNEIGTSRRNVLKQACFIWPIGEDKERYIDKVICSGQNALHEILKRSSHGEDIRIWYSNNPDDICGFYWLLAQLNSIPITGHIYMIKLPEWEYLQLDTLRVHRGWGDILPGEWERYLLLQQEVKIPLLSTCAMRWKQLQEENAPLRIYLNGKIQSAPENIYDSFILRELNAQASEFIEGEVICNILNKYQLGIGDAWIALRVESFIKEGLFEIVSSPAPGRPIYSRMLRKQMSEKEMWYSYF